MPWMSRRIAAFLAALASLAVTTPAARAHPALYHYLELNLHRPGEIVVFLTVHAPELSDQVAPLEEDVFGAEWLASLDDGTIDGLVRNAQTFFEDHFALSLDGTIQNPVLQFPEAAAIRRPPPGDVVPAGCFSGEALLRYSTGTESLRVDFMPVADKRLMLVVNRPGRFPEVVDLEPGESRELDLPAVPAPSQVTQPATLAPAKISSRKGLGLAIQVAVGTAVLGGISMLRRRGLVFRSSLMP